MVSILVIGDVESKCLTGDFRVVLDGKSPLRFPIELERYLGSNLLPECDLSVVVEPQKICLKDNSYFSGWHSVNEELYQAAICLDSNGSTQNLRRSCGRMQGQS